MPRIRFVMIYRLSSRERLGSSADPSSPPSSSATSAVTLHTAIRAELPFTTAHCLSEASAAQHCASVYQVILGTAQLQSSSIAMLSTPLTIRMKPSSPCNANRKKGKVQAGIQVRLSAHNIARHLSSCTACRTHPVAAPAIAADPKYSRRNRKSRRVGRRETSRENLFPRLLQPLPE